MLSNYLKIAIRNLRRQKSFSIINISGLAIGMACTFLLVSWIMDELKFDNFHKNRNEIYRIIQDKQFTNNHTQWAITQGPLGQSLTESFPQVINSSRLLEIGRYWQPLISREDKKFYENKFYAVDPEFLEMFTFPIVTGNSSTALDDMQSIVITETMAEKYFGKKNPLDEILQLDNQYSFRITGVLHNIPNNSSFDFDFLIPYEFALKLGFDIDQWNNSQITTFIQLQKDIHANQIAEQISGFLRDKPTDDKRAKLILQPFPDIHLYSHFEFDRFGFGSVINVNICFIIAIFILLIACINYMNLVTAHSAIRHKEISMRKVTGAKKRDIIKQFFSESLILSLIAFVLAIGITQILLPLFNNISGKELKFDLFLNPDMLIIFLAIPVAAGLVSGIYPALFLSSLHPLRLLNKSILVNDNTFSFRKILVVFQFSLSIILIIGTIMVFNQLEFMRNNKLGYNKDHIITIRINDELTKPYNSFKNDLKQNPDIISVTATSDLPNRGFCFSNDSWDWEGKNPDDNILMRGLYVDYDYFKTFDIQIAQGRAYSPEFPGDSSNAIIVNEAAIKAIGMKNPIGKWLGGKDYTPEIIGVIKDYHFQSLHSKIDPLVLLFFGIETCQHICIRINSENIDQTIKYINSTWNKFNPNYPFEFKFLDESLNKLYSREEQIGDILKYFTGLAIFISSLGLLGLSTCIAQKRTKEIGIRKVLGASVLDVIILLSKKFTRWILVANLIAWPIAWFVIDKWLQNFAYRTDISWWVFLLAGGFALIIAVLTISTHAAKSAIANPVESLRCE